MKKIDMKAFLLFTGILLLSINMSVASQNDTISSYSRERLFQVSFVYPLGTDGVSSLKSNYNVSLNILGGHTNGIKGFEASGFLNMNQSYVNGAQFSGFLNLTGHSSSIKTSGAWQFAGFGNVNHTNVVGGQFAGFINTSKSLNGGQFAGFINISDSIIKSCQVAGFMNLATQSESSAQIAGFGNISGKETVNSQVGGFINVAHYVKGVQLAGFINYCDSIDGIPIAPISIVKNNGYRSFEISTSDFSVVQASYKLGVSEFYSIYNISKLFGEASSWAYGFGIGTESKLGEESLVNPELMVYQSLWLGNGNAPKGLYTDRTNMVVQFRLGMAFDLMNSAKWFIAPTLNWGIASNKNNVLGDNISPVWDSKLVERTVGKTDVGFWIGYTAGIRF